MPERKNKLYRKVESDEVQGKGSWVKLKAPTLEDIRTQTFPGEGDNSAALDFGANIVSRLVVAWNWVDDEGEPLPKPTPEIVNGLPYAEIEFLMNALDLEALTDQKN